MRRRRSIDQLLALVTTTVLAALSTWVASESMAEDGPVGTEDDTARYVGTYKYGGDLDHGRAIVRKAMNEVIDQLPAVYRGLARRRLERSDPLVHTIVIALPEGRISVTYIGEKRATLTTRPGVTEKVRNPNNEEVDLTQRFTKEGLEQVFVGPRGRSRSVYTLLPDGKRLVVASKLYGEQLETPVSYRLVYTKQ